eukprot:gnl/MRDRNA2_/MRDRNA2_31462_c0_seq1.p1 gnl/MRDRNA2_/MRDRNA2_31462_c0~~gnl/MRDRNA2_/MRDRNA2_31462_c0_seq1.p1  ORF type:complete len:1007 (+),score=194.74 gnl/MRDRNA2_/MRDRNA2_31462_c0_seq1:177-3197(+)
MPLYHGGDANKKHKSLRSWFSQVAGRREGNFPLLWEIERNKTRYNVYSQNENQRKRNHLPDHRSGADSAGYRKELEDAFSQLKEHAPTDVATSAFSEILSGGSSPSHRFQFEGERHHPRGLGHDEGYQTPKSKPSQTKEHASGPRRPPIPDYWPTLYCPGGQEFTDLLPPSPKSSEQSSSPEKRSSKEPERRGSKESERPGSKELARRVSIEDKSNSKEKSSALLGALYSLRRSSKESGAGGDVKSAIKAVQDAIAISPLERSEQRWMMNLTQQLSALSKNTSNSHLQRVLKKWVETSAFPERDSIHRDEHETKKADLGAERLAFKSSPENDDFDAETLASKHSELRNLLEKVSALDPDNPHVEERKRALVTLEGKRDTPETLREQTEDLEKSLVPVQELGGQQHVTNCKFQRALLIAKRKIELLEVLRDATDAFEKASGQQKQIVEAILHGKTAAEVAPEVMDFKPVLDRSVHVGGEPQEADIGKTDFKVFLKTFGLPSGHIYVVRAQALLQDQQAQWPWAAFSATEAATDSLKGKKILAMVPNLKELLSLLNAMGCSSQSPPFMGIHERWLNVQGLAVAWKAQQEWEARGRSLSTLVGVSTDRIMNEVSKAIQAGIDRKNPHLENAVNFAARLVEWKAQQEVEARTGVAISKDDGDSPSIDIGLDDSPSSSMTHHRPISSISPRSPHSPIAERKGKEFTAETVSRIMKEIEGVVQGGADRKNQHLQAAVTLAARLVEWYAQQEWNARTKVPVAKPGSIAALVASSSTAPAGPYISSDIEITAEQRIMEQVKQAVKAGVNRANVHLVASANIAARIVEWKAQQKWYAYGPDVPSEQQGDAAREERRGSRAEEGRKKGDEERRGGATEGADQIMKDVAAAIQVGVPERSKHLKEAVTLAARLVEWSAQQEWEAYALKASCCYPNPMPPGPGIEAANRIMEEVQAAIKSRIPKDSKHVRKAEKLAERLREEDGLCRRRASKERAKYIAEAQRKMNVDGSSSPQNYIE